MVSWSATGPAMESKVKFVNPPMRCINLKQHTITPRRAIRLLPGHPCLHTRYLKRRKKIKKEPTRPPVSGFPRSKLQDDFEWRGKIHRVSYSEPFRSGFQTESRNTAHFPECFFVFLPFRTLSIGTETETGLYHSHLNL